MKSNESVSDSVRQLAKALRSAADWSEVEAIINNQNPQVKAEVWRALTREERDRIKALKPSLDLEQAARELAAIASFEEFSIFLSQWPQDVSEQILHYFAGSTNDYEAIEQKHTWWEKYIAEVHLN
jgi:hypothetical protein